MVSELTRGHVNKFSGLSPIEKFRFFHSGFRFTLRIVRLNPPQVFTGLVSWVIISLSYLFFRCFA